MIRNSRPSNNRRHKWWHHAFHRSPSIALIICACLTLLCSACQKENKEGGEEAAKAPAAPPAKVKVETVKQSEVTEKSTLIGRLDSRQSVALYPKVDGSIEQISVKPGDHVQKGRLIMEIDSLKQEAAVATKKSDVATAQADYQKEVARWKSLKAEREAQMASVEYEKHEYVRNYWLEQRGVVSESTVDGHDRSFKVSTAKLAEVDENIAAQKEVINRAARSIDAAVSSLKEQKEQLAFYRITAPFAGTIADIPVKLGDFVSPSIKLTTVSQLKPLELNLLVPKAMAQGMHKGMTVEIVDDKNAVIASCPIFHIDPVVDQQNQSVLIKALYDNAAEMFRPDQSVSARLILSQNKGITIPTDALSFVGGRAFAYVVANGEGSTPVAKQRLLQVDSLEGNRAVLLSGITAGERVVVSGVQNLRDGSPIVIE